MYSLGGRLRSGASDERMKYSLSSRCIMNGTQASPLSIQITGSSENRSDRPSSTQFVMCTMLQSTNEIACTPMNRSIWLVHSSCQVGPAWKPSGRPVSWIAE